MNVFKRILTGFLVIAISITILPLMKSTTVFANTTKTVVQYQGEISNSMVYETEKWVNYPNTTYGTYPSTISYNQDGYTGTLTAKRIKMVPQNRLDHTITGRTTTLTQYWTDSSYREFASDSPVPNTYSGTYYDSASNSNVAYSLPKSGGLYSIGSKVDYIYWTSPGSKYHYDKEYNYYYGYMSGNATTYGTYGNAFYGRWSDAKPNFWPSDYYGIPRDIINNDYTLVDMGWDDPAVVNADTFASQGYASKLVYRNGSYWFRSEAGNYNKYRRGIWLKYQIKVNLYQYRQKYYGSIALPNYVDYQYSNKWKVYVEYSGTISKKPEHVSHSITNHAYKNGNDYWVSGGSSINYTNRGTDSDSGLHLLYARLSGSGADSRAYHNFSESASYMNHWDKDPHIVFNSATRTYNSGGTGEVRWNISFDNYEGDYDVQWYYQDYSGNNSGDYGDTGMNVRVDSTAPTPVTITPSISSWTNQDVTITLKQGTDSRSGIARNEYKIGTGSWITYTAPFNITASGSTTVSARSIDNVGNVSAVSSIIVTKDTTAPTITATPSSRDWGKAISVTLNYADTGGSGLKDKQYQWSTSATTPTTGWINYTTAVTKPDNGTWYLHARATDNAGNVTTESFGTYKVDKTKPTVTFNPNGRNHTHEYIVSVNVNDTYSGIESIRYSFNNSTQPTTWSNATGNFQVTISEEGTYYIHVEVTDKAGNITQTRSNPFVLDNKAPTLTVNYSPNPTMIYGDTLVNIQVMDVENDLIDLDFELIDPNGNKVDEYSYIGLNSAEIRSFNFTPIIYGGWTIQGVISDLFDSNRTNFSYVIPVLDADIEGKVLHTDLWEGNRQKFNISKSGSIDSPRSYDYFFSGEMFLLEANILNSDLAVSVEVILKNTPFSVQLVRETDNKWIGSLWDISMMGWKDKTLEFDFIVSYQNGYKPNDVQTVHINSDSFFRMKQDH